MGKRHLTPQEIMRQCNRIAREKRICNRSTWTAISILMAHAVWKSEGFKGKRLNALVQKSNEFEELYQEGKVSMDELSNKLWDKAEWKVVYEPYTEADIIHRKGSFDHWFDSVQIPIQNEINELATRYMTYFYNALIEMHGFGKVRLGRVNAAFEEVLNTYKYDKSIIDQCKKDLAYDAGIVFESPKDSKDMYGSFLTNCS